MNTITLVLLSCQVILTMCIGVLSWRLDAATRDVSDTRYLRHVTTPVLLIVVTINAAYLTHPIFAHLCQVATLFYMVWVGMRLSPPNWAD